MIAKLESYELLFNTQVCFFMTFNDYLFMIKNDVFLQTMKTSIIIIFFFLAISVFAQSPSSDNNEEMKNRPFPKDTLWAKKSNDYYDDYSNLLGLFLQAKHKSTNFIIKDRFSGKTLDYSPENQLYLGPGFTYKIIGNGLSMNFGFLNKTQGGEPTKRIDLYVNLIMKKVVFDFGFRYYQNFTLKNAEALYSGSNNTNKAYIRPDIRTLYMGMGAVYVLSYKKFSYRAAFTQTAIQKKSAGSFMFGSQLFLQGVVGDSSIFPKQTALPEVTTHSSIYLGFTVAYAYNLIIKKHYFMALTLSSSIEFGKAVTVLNTGDRYRNRLPILHLQPRLVAGINKPKWYAGVSLMRDYFVPIFTSNENQFEFSFRSGNVRLFYGMRFNWLSRKQLKE